MGQSRGDAVNGLDIVTTLARQLAEHLEEVASAVRVRQRRVCGEMWVW